MITWPIGDHEATFSADETFQTIVGEQRGASSHRKHGRLVNEPLETPWPGYDDFEALSLVAPISVTPPRSRLPRISKLLSSVWMKGERLILESQFGIPAPGGALTIYTRRFDSDVHGELTEEELNRLAWGHGWPEYDARSAVYAVGQEPWRK